MNTCGAEPSLIRKVYWVPGGLAEILLMANLRESDAQTSVLPRLANPPAGVEPTKTMYFLMPIQPSVPVTLTVMLLLPNGKICFIIEAAGQVLKLVSGVP